MASPPSMLVQGGESLAADLLLPILSTESKQFLRICPPISLPSTSQTADLLAISDTNGLVAIGAASGSSSSSSAPATAILVHETKELRRLLRESAKGDKPELKEPWRKLNSPNGATIVSVKFAHADSCIVAALENATVVVWKLEQLRAYQLDPAATIQPPLTGSSCHSLLPNPSAYVNYVFLLVSEGQTHTAKPFMIDLNSSATVPLPLDIGSDFITAACWSVKGKQLALGLSSGQLVQVSPDDGTIKARLPRPQSDDLQPESYVSDLFWIENDAFIVAYNTPAVSADESEDPPHDDYVFALSRSPDGSLTHSALSDPSPAFGLTRLRSKRYLCHIKAWSPFRNAVFMASAPSTDVGLLARKEDGEQGWEALELEETSRPTLPFSSVDNESDTAPLGLALDLSLPRGEDEDRERPTDPRAAARGEDENKKMPYTPPRLWLLNSDGILGAWFILNLTEAAAGGYPGMSAVGDGTTSSTATAQAASTPKPSTPIPATFGQAQTSTSGFAGFGSSAATASSSKDSVQSSSSNAFAQPGTTAPAAATFGSSSFGSSSFGNPSAFGAAATPSAFGTSSPSVFGSPASSAFGKPSAFGSQPAAPSTPSTSAKTFGSPSAFGSASSSTPSGFAGFGQTSSFGKPATPSTSNTAAPSAFGSSSGFGQTSGFGQSSGFGQKASAFGQPAALGSKPASVFGSTSVAAASSPGTPTGGSAFGSFGGSSSFGSLAAKKTGEGGSVFGSASPASTSTGGFGAFGGGATNGFGSKAAGSPASSSIFGSGGSFGTPTQTTPTFGQPVKAKPITRADPAEQMDAADDSGAADGGSFGFGGLGGMLGESEKAAASPSPAPQEPKAEALASAPPAFSFAPAAKSPASSFSFSQPASTQKPDAPDEKKAAPDAKASTPSFGLAGQQPAAKAAFSFGQPSSEPEASKDASPAASPAAEPDKAVSEKESVPETIPAAATSTLVDSDATSEDKVNDAHRSGPPEIEKDRESQGNLKDGSSRTAKEEANVAKEEAGNESAEALPYKIDDAKTAELEPSQSTKSEGKPEGESSLEAQAGDRAAAKPSAESSAPAKDQRTSGFSFGSNTKDTPAAQSAQGGFGFGSAQQNSGQASFDFGQTAPQSSEKAPSFSFGSQSANKDLITAPASSGSVSTPGTGFGSASPASAVPIQRSTSPTGTPTAQKPAFSFEADTKKTPASTTPISEKPAFSFGSTTPKTPTIAQPAPAEPASPGSTTGPAATAAPAASPNNVPAFGKGAPAFGSFGTGLVGQRISTTPGRSSPLAGKPVSSKDFTQTTSESTNSLGKTPASSLFGGQPASGFAQTTQAAASKPAFSFGTPAQASSSNLTPVARQVPPAANASISPILPASQALPPPVTQAPPLSKPSAPKPSTPATGAPVFNGTPPRLGGSVETLGPREVQEGGLAGEFLKTFLIMEEELKLLKSNIAQCVAFQAHIREPGGQRLQQPEEWTFGDLPLISKVQSSLGSKVKKIDEAVSEHQKDMAELEAGLFKAEAKRDEAARFLRAHTDPEFAKLVRVRELGPEHVQNQAHLRALTQTVKTRAQDIETFLVDLRNRVRDQQLGRTHVKAPSLDAIQRTVRNISHTATAKSLELDDLLTELELLKGRDRSVLRTSQRSESVMSRRSPFLEEADTSMSATKKSDAPLQSISALGAALPPLRARGAAEGVSEAIKARQVTQSLASSLLGARKEPILNQSAADNARRRGAANGREFQISDLQIAFANGPVNVPSSRPRLATPSVKRQEPEPEVAPPESPKPMGAEGQQPEVAKPFSGFGNFSVPTNIGKPNTLGPLPETSTFNPGGLESRESSSSAARRDHVRKSRTTAVRLPPTASSETSASGGTTPPTSSQAPSDFFARPATGTAGAAGTGASGFALGNKDKGKPKEPTFFASAPAAEQKPSSTFSFAPSGAGNAFAADTQKPAFSFASGNATSTTPQKPAFSFAPASTAAAASPKPTFSFSSGNNSTTPQKAPPATNTFSFGNSTTPKAAAPTSSAFGSSASAFGSSAFGKVPGSDFQTFGGVRPSQDLKFGAAEIPAAATKAKSKRAMDSEPEAEEDDEEEYGDSADETQGKAAITGGAEATEEVGEQEEEDEEYEGEYDEDEYDEEEEEEEDESGEEGEEEVVDDEEWQEGDGEAGDDDDEEEGLSAVEEEEEDEG